MSHTENIWEKNKVDEFCLVIDLTVIKIYISKWGPPSQDYLRVLNRAI